MSAVIHVGQCGNQLGNAFWRLAADASDTAARTPIAPPLTKKSGGVLKPARTGTPPLPMLYTDCLFHRASRRARCILVDTEPKVIRSVLRNQYDAASWRLEPAHIHYEQSGRGNNWAMGYNLQTHQRNVLPSKSDTASLVGVATTRTAKHKLRLAAAATESKRELVELVMESLRREIEAVDAYRGTMLMHSLGGGTGAGLGCRLLETIRDTYPQSYLGAVSVAPSLASGDTPLQNYNALFTLQHLQEHTDWVVYKDNDDLMRTAWYWKSLVAPRDADGSTVKVSLREMNALVATDVAGLVFPMVRKHGERGLVAQPFDMAKLVHDCCPVSTVKFLDTRTGVSRNASSKKVRVGSGDPLFHAVPTTSPTGGDDVEMSMVKLLRLTMQAFPRSASGGRAITASTVVRFASLGPHKVSGTDFFIKALDSDLPQHHLDTRVPIQHSLFAPFQSCSARASVTVTLNNGHAIPSINHFIDRGRRQFEARAYTHWYKQYGLEDTDFENALEQSTKIIQSYDEMLHARFKPRRSWHHEDV
jgi:hypothetical protein